MDVLLDDDDNDDDDNNDGDGHFGFRRSSLYLHRTLILRR
jgi:hypothetical protein